MNQNKTMLIVAAVAIIVLILGGVFLASSKNKNSGAKKTTNTESGLSDENSDVIPTVDSSVKVNLTADANKYNVTLAVGSVPSGTTSIEYSLSYQTAQQGLQGIIGTIDATAGKKDYSITRELGTCSSGTCIHHKVEGAIKVELKFNGSYGARLFDHEYTI